MKVSASRHRECSRRDCWGPDAACPREWRKHLLQRAWMSTAGCPEEQEHSISARALTVGNP